MTDCPPAAELPEMVLLLTLSVPALAIAPPNPGWPKPLLKGPDVELLLTVLSLMAIAPLLKIPPKLLVIMQLVRFRVPVLLFRTPLLPLPAIIQPLTFTI